MVSEELAAEWNAINERKVEPGPGFGSQHVFQRLGVRDVPDGSVPEALRLRVLAFDWWIRNQDRGGEESQLALERRDARSSRHRSRSGGTDVGRGAVSGEHFFSKAWRHRTSPGLPAELAAESKMHAHGCSFAVARGVAFRVDNELGRANLVRSPTSTQA